MRIPRSAVAASGPAHNLPAPLSDVIGRDREIAELARLLVRPAGPRLLTLTGAGGIGKTSLALTVARRLEGRFPDGIWLVELAHLNRPDLVTHAAAAVFDLREGPEQPLLDTLVAYLGPRTLLLLDNCEHLVESCAQLAAALLRAAPRLRILATSREPLRVAGEVLWRVPSLALPVVDRQAAADVVAASPAVQVFLARARAVRPGFALTSANAQAVAQLCMRLDGIPLALELAAARTRVLAVEQIVERLDDCFQLLTDGSRVATTRQQTLRATLDWSHDLLSAAEQTLFRRLAVFLGGWSLEAAETVCAGGAVGTADVLGLLARLVDRSLVQVEEQEGEARYRLLEPIRQYARQRLVASGESGTVERAHAAYFLALAEQAETALWRGPHQVAWLRRMERERGNLREALRWAAEGEESEQLLRLAASLWIFWRLRGPISEGQQWLETAIERGERAAAGLRARALNAAGIMAREHNEPERAIALCRRGLDLFREIGDRAGMACALHMLGLVARDQGHYEMARAHLAESLQLFRQVGDSRFALSALRNLGITAVLEGDHATASALLEECRVLAQAIDNPWELGRTLTYLASVAVEQGKLEQGRVLAGESLALLRTLGARRELADCLDVLAVLAGRRGHHVSAARLFGAAEALREATGAPLPPAERAARDRHAAVVRARLGEASFAAAWTSGRALALEQAVAPALRQEETRPAARRASAHATASAPPSPISRREREVAALIGRGLTNRQIAEELVISEGTAARHVANILGKLGFRSRAQIAAWAAEHVLMPPSLDAAPWPPRR